MTLLAGTRLGPYEILSPIGAGGMGEVYRARDSKLDRDVALKVLPARLAADRDALARFEREAKAVAALSHPNILAIYDFGQAEGRHYAVMELLEGQTFTLLHGAFEVSSRRASVAFASTCCARTHALICCAESDCRQDDRYRLCELFERSLVMLRGWRKTLAFPVLFLVAAALLAQQKGDAKKPVVWPGTDLKWEPVADAPPGVMGATLWGDRTKGAYGAIQKFPPGFSVGLHTHSAALKVVIISGTVIHGPEGKPDVRLSAGSYLFEPPTYRHTTACDKASECVFFIEGNGKFDVKMVEEAPAK